MRHLHLARQTEPYALQPQAPHWLDGAGQTTHPHGQHYVASSHATWLTCPLPRNKAPQTRDHRSDLGATRRSHNQKTRRLISNSMYDHQSQVPSTHRTPFEVWLKKVLRLNRDPVLFFAHRRYTRGSRGGFLVTAASARAVVRAIPHVHTQPAG
jgi:hypothetical protein